MIRYSLDLSGDSRTLLEATRARLRDLGCSEFVDEDWEASAWVTTAFPRWAAADTFPFFLPARVSSCDLISPRQPLPKRRLMSLLGVSDLLLINGYQGTRPINRNGFLVLGADLGGSYIAIDTKSESGLDIAMLDTGAIASSGVRKKYIVPFRKRIDQFLEWIHHSPEAFRSALGNWYQGNEIV